MLSVIAASRTPENVPIGVVPDLIRNEEKNLAQALRIEPQVDVERSKRHLKVVAPNPFRSTLAAVMPPSALRLNRISCFLYMVSGNFFLFCV